MPFATGLRDDLAPRADDKTVTPARALIIVNADLTSCNNVAQRLDSTCLQQRLPVHDTGIRMESRRVDENGGTVALVVQSQLCESQVETDGRADFADDRLEGREDLVTRLGRVALFHRRAVGLVHVEEMSLDVSLGDLAVFIDPEETVFEFLRVRVIAGLVDTDRDGKGVLFGRFLEAENKWRFVDGLAELLGLFGTAGEVVGGLGEEDGLRSCELCDLARAYNDVPYLGTFGDSLVNYKAALLQVVFQ
jgi:hypothetical protein